MMKPIFAAVLLASACFAQQPEFEVATIKPSPPPTMGRMFMGTRGGPGTDDPGRFTCNNCTLQMLLTMAYDVQRFQISGPATLETEHFEVAAKVPAGATKAQFREMIANLLADRFKLKLHHETKDLPIYDLVVAKGGPKLKESAAQPDASADQRPAGPPRTDKDGYPVMAPHGRGSMMAITPRGARMQGEQETMDGLAGRLSSIVARPVKNETGLTGKYDFTLSFAPDMSSMPGAMMMGPPPGGEAPGAGAPQDNGPTIFTALQEQLGLKLEPKKGPVDTLIIDHVERAPTEN
jgi:uncharacterized protein (TIGR03435 family)